MSFTSRNAVKSALRIPATLTDSDELIDLLINGIHGTILADIGGGLTAAQLTSYTEYFDVERAGLSGIRLPKWPVGAVTEVRTGTANGATGSVLASTDYRVSETGTLRLVGDLTGSPHRGLSSHWPVGRKNVKVTWTAGFVQGTKDHESLALAELICVCDQFNTIGVSGKGSERIGNYSYTLVNADTAAGGPVGAVYPARAERIISRYRQVFATDTVVP